MAESGGWPGALTGVRGGILKISLILAAVYLLVFLLPRSFEAADYRHFPVIVSRVLVWCLAQAHLMFAAFVLGVPIFVLIAEVLGVVLKNERYDGLAKEFTRLLAMSYTITDTDYKVVKINPARAFRLGQLNCNRKPEAKGSCVLPQPLNWSGTTNKKTP